MNGCVKNTHKIHIILVYLDTQFVENIILNIGSNYWEAQVANHFISSIFKFSFSCFTFSNIIVIRLRRH